MWSLFNTYSRNTHSNEIALCYCCWWCCSMSIFTAPIYHSFFRTMFEISRIGATIPLLLFSLHIISAHCSLSFCISFSNFRDFVFGFTRFKWYFECAHLCWNLWNERCGWNSISMHVWVCKNTVTIPRVHRHLYTSLTYRISYVTRKTSNRFSYECCNMLDIIANLTF